MKHFIPLLLLFLFSCSESEKNIGHDPSKPIVFEDFSPKEGSVRTRLYITGSNFGNDVSKIHVNVGGKEAKVIGSNGKEIYCMVPKRAYDGKVTATIDGENGESAIDFTFEDEFTYHAKQTVGTLIRNVDEDGQGSWIEGPFAEASVYGGDWLVMGPPQDGKKVYLGTYGGGIYVLDLETETMTKLFGKLHNEMQTFTFTADGDTLLIPDDNGQGTNTDRPNIYYALRSEKFRKQHVYSYGTCSYSVVSHPDDRTVFYTSWIRGGVYKKDGQFNATTGKWEPKRCFELGNLVQIDGAHPHLIMHPTGKYMYIVCEQVTAVLRSDYNPITKEFEYPRVIAGHLSATGYTDGVGGAARFDRIYAGVFVKNREYEAAGKEDIYDFYATEKWNCDVRKITPEGVVTTFAGRSNSSSDGKTHGYVDGDLRQEARFNQPIGITYDEEMETFYIGELENHDIRYITTE